MSDRIHITFCYSPQSQQALEYPFDFADGTPVCDAIDFIQKQLHLLPEQIEHFGIWGRLAKTTDMLRQGDRIECYRPLLVDPKVARRKRFKRQGAKRSGLFAQRRPGSVPGY
jgi:sulfur carrier protein